MVNILTTKNDYKTEVEYDELLGKPVYGWSLKKGHPIYKPSIGISKIPPKFKDAGKKWREVLLERFEQASFYGGDDTVVDEFDGVFQNSITMKRKCNI